VRVDGVRRGSGEIAVVSRRIRSQSSSGSRGRSYAGVKGLVGRLEALGGRIALDRCHEFTRYRMED
jgi:hypothetical protein